MLYRCYDLYEDITDGRGLAYREVKICGLLGALIFFIFNREPGRRIEYSNPLATEVLEKKNYFKHSKMRISKSEGDADE